MADGSTIIAGIPIPFESPVFLSVVGLHVLAGLGCVATSLMAMLSAKGRGQHSNFGTTYFWFLAVVFASMTVLAVACWAQDYDLFILGALSFAAAYTGRTALRRRWRNWPRIHLIGMGTSYILLTTAFIRGQRQELAALERTSPNCILAIAKRDRRSDHRLRAIARHPLFRDVKKAASVRE